MTATTQMQSTDVPERRGRRKQMTVAFGALAVTAAALVGAAVLIGDDDPPEVGTVPEPATGPIAPSGPSARFQHSATWTGDEMIVWGGGTIDGPELGDGAAYDPVPRTWRPIADAPIDARSAHSAVWTGEKMIVWGGSKSGIAFTDGATYDPDTDSWEPIPDAPIRGRHGHDAVWTGHEMIVWGGGFGTSYNDGARYDPSTRAWRELPPAPLLSGGPPLADAIWTGTELVVVNVPEEIDEGNLSLAAYNPETDSWRQLPDPPTNEPMLAALADNTLVLLPRYGGPGYALDETAQRWHVTSPIPETATPLLAATADGGTLFAVGAKAATYNAPTDRWTLTDTSDPAPRPRSAESAVSDGTALIVWGGWDDFSEVGGGFRAEPASAPPTTADDLFALPLAPESTVEPILEGDSAGDYHAIRDTRWGIQMFEILDPNGERVGYFGCVPYTLDEIDNGTADPERDCGIEPEPPR